MVPLSWLVYEGKEGGGNRGTPVQAGGGGGEETGQGIPQR